MSTTERRSRYVTDDVPDSVATRLPDAIEAGANAFFTAITEAFPEAVAGDVDFGFPAEFERATTDFVLAWLQWNAPDLYDVETGEWKA